MILKIHIQKEREVIMYYHFSTTTSMPFGNGRLISRSATIGLDKSKTEIELNYFQSYAPSNDKEIPLYIKSSIGSIKQDESTDLWNCIINANHDAKAVLLVDDFDYFMTLLHDSKFQHPEEELEGSFCILANMTIHSISDDADVVLATIPRKMNNK